MNLTIIFALILSSVLWVHRNYWSNIICSLEFLPQTKCHSVIKEWMVDRKLKCLLEWPNMCVYLYVVLVQRAIRASNIAIANCFKIWSMVMSISGVARYFVLI